jgi:uncharacterized protein YecT (DUF1311 family)
MILASMFAARNNLVAASALLIGVALFAPASWSAERKIPSESEELEICVEGGVPLAIARCLMEAVKKDGAILDLEYKEALVRSGTHSEKLRASQRAWLKYQQSTCAATKSAGLREGLGFAELDYAKCALRTTIKRIDEIKGLSAAYSD